MSEHLRRFMADHPGRDFDRQGLKLHYIDEGSGEPVVMIHGNPTWSFLFRHLIDALKGTHRVVAPDQIGCGLSDKPADWRYSYTLLSRVDDLESLLDHLGLVRELTLVMHDWGGMIGMTYAARHPDRIARLVVCNTAAFHKPDSKHMPPALTLCRNSLLGSFLVQGLNLFCNGTAWLGCKQVRMTRDLRRAYVAPYDSWAHRLAVLRFVQDIPLAPGDQSYELVSWTQDRLSLLESVPILVLWGLKDFVFDRHFLAEWERRFPSAQLHRFAGAGHYVLEDEPAASSELVATFLASHPMIPEHVG
jgi:pimeloyl-ACP methyl ester carboxylesterase